jgi:predicted enzyme related to lactoylglutathione lyase
MQKQANRKSYPAGVPCWVEAVVPDARAATVFYKAVFGWQPNGPGPMPDGGEYFVAHLEGDEVAGIGTLPAGATPHWATYVRVDDVDDTVRRANAAGGATIVPPLDAPPAGRLAVIADPSGATLGLWQPHERDGAQRVNEPSAWAMSALRTADLERVRHFYATTFGWTEEPFDVGDGRAVLYRRAGYVGGTPRQPVPRDVVAVGLEDPSIETAHWSVDFWIADVNDAVARVTRFGGSVLVAPFDAGPFRRAVVADPAGAIFTLSELVPQRLS